MLHFLCFQNYSVKGLAYINFSKIDINIENDVIVYTVYIDNRVTGER